MWCSKCERMLDATKDFYADERRDTGCSKHCRTCSYRHLAAMPLDKAQAAYTRLTTYHDRKPGIKRAARRQRLIARINDARQGIIEMNAELASLERKDAHERPAN